MIYGIGTDISKVSRFEKWVKNEEFIKRFFNSQEIMENGSLNAKCEHYAARFAAKEAFSKALGTGITGFSLKDVFITNDENGKPHIEFIDVEFPQIESIDISISHSKEYAVAQVVVLCKE